MAGKDKSRKVRSESMALDTMHIVIGIAVVVLAVISFINPDDHMILFPVIFLLAAVLNLVTGNFHLGRSKRDNRKKMSAALQMVFGILLLVLAAVSAISIWWR